MEKAFRIKTANWLVEIVIPVVVLAIIAATIGWAVGEITFHFILATVLLTAGMTYLFFVLRLKNATHLFVDFFEMYRNGEADKIIEQMNEIRLII